MHTGHSNDTNEDGDNIEHDNEEEDNSPNVSGI